MESYEREGIEFVVDQRIRVSHTDSVNIYSRGAGTISMKQIQCEKCRGQTYVWNNVTISFCFVPENKFHLIMSVQCEHDMRFVTADQVPHQHNF